MKEEKIDKETLFKALKDLENIKFEHNKGLIKLETKYYTPIIEDLYIGYECEWSKNKINWESFKVISSNNISPTVLKNLRTPYLSKEDIESLGWIYDIEKSTNNTVWDHYYIDAGYNMWTLCKARKDTIFDDGQNGIQIWQDNERGCNGQSYIIPSINELRKVMQYLNIK